MKIGLFGGTGLIGSKLAQKLAAADHQVIIFSRSPKLPEPLAGHHSIQLLQSQLPDFEHINGLDGIINLAGEPILSGRWNAEKKQKLWKSRVGFTRSLVSELRKCQNTPAFFINASAIGIYGMHPGAQPVLTESSQPGDDFLANLCFEWEKEAAKAEKLNIRTIIPRIGIVLSKQGGALKQMLLLFQLGLGGPVAGGKQYMSWIHIEDIISALQFFIENDSIHGVFNMTTANPVTNDEFGRTLARVLSRPYLFPVPGFALKTLYGEGAQIVAMGQNVLPAALQQQPFSFQYPTLEVALKNLLSS